MCALLWGCVYASACVCIHLCVYVSEEGVRRSPVVDLLLAAGQVSCVAASLYSGTAELGLQSTHNTQKVSKLTHSNMHRHRSTYALFFSVLLPPDTHLADGINSLASLSSSFTHIHHSVSCWQVNHRIHMLASAYAVSYKHTHFTSHTSITIPNLFCIPLYSCGIGHIFHIYTDLCFCANTLMS